MLDVFYLILGVGLLTVGGNFLIRGALGISMRAGISPLLTGLVIVGFGTSMPELVVSVGAALSGQPDIAIGNVVGSNIANILLVLGLCAAITPLFISALSLRRDAVAVMASSCLFMLIVLDGSLSWIDATILLSALVGYLIWAYRTEKKANMPLAHVLEDEITEDEVTEDEITQIAVKPKAIIWTVAETIGGLALLIAGSQILLKGAVGIAIGLGVSEAVIGLTLVAVGTSLPELTISVIAAFRKHADVAIGNILGSNIFNLLGILGVSAILQPIAVAGRVITFDQWVMLGSSILLYIFLLSGRKLSRVEGGLLLLGYFAYIAVSYIYFPN
ncbi:calcium/sodium antiporter [Brumicola nitratireducens]|uniref:Sodium/calcium exchanger n=1 Tax=Glaciecola nitratireducens (strain JCM 12485 / KCTC 12276 / FR1064) TaxID=1085623 RepID=G4QI72_GLANF|nr:calcium/sodium antiporter [Glaciecola nitratireducens]AEP30686.1 sodium/calcium exchanger [Glaciecola nitratireducens FR1064]